MEHKKELLSIDLSMLVPSPHNVRRHTAGQVEELAALIDSQGLLHNLVVTEQVVGRGKARKPKFAVAAGERRRCALLLLQQRGRLPKQHEVLCELVPPERALEVNRELKAAEQDELDALARRGTELEQQVQALDDAPEWSPDEAEMIDLEEQDIAARRKTIYETLKVWTPEQKTHAGVIVATGREGDIEVLRGLVRDEDRKAVAAAARSTGATDHRAHHCTDDDQGSPSPSSASARRSPGCSEALTKRLAAHRTMALRAMLAQNSTVALASVVHVFVLRAFGADYPREASALQVSPQLSAYALEASADDLKASRAWQAVQQAKEAWRARLPEHSGEWFGWLIGLPQAELIDLLALCSALTVNALPGAGASASASAIAAALGLDMADWWEPTAETYLNHVPKAQIIAALKEVGPELAGGGVEAMKKAALVSAAASRLAGTRWLPEPLRRPPG